MSQPRNRSLILTIDAFETLIKPRIPIVDQYRQEAARFGVQFNPKLFDVGFGREFKKAFYANHLQYPNFGGGAGKTAIGYNEWWSRVINLTFRQFTDESIPKELAPALVKRFSSSEGYELHHDALPFLELLSSSNPSWRYPPLVTIPPGGTAPPDKPMTILGLLSNGDPRIPLVLESLGIAQYFSFQNLSYDTGYEKPSREAFRLARLAGLRLAKGDSSYKTKDPTTGTEMRLAWLGWDYIHVGDNVCDDWVAARKVMDAQPIWLNRDGLGLKSEGEDARKFIKRGAKDRYPPQMPHMAEGMKNWTKQKWSHTGDWLKINNDSKIEAFLYELMSSTITELTELPQLFPHIEVPLAFADSDPMSIALSDPDKWHEVVQKDRKEREKNNLQVLDRAAKMRYEEKKKFWENQQEKKQNEQRLLREKRQNRRVQKEREKEKAGDSPGYWHVRLRGDFVSYRRIKPPTEYTRSVKLDWDHRDRRR